jgi:hypothetical protein
MAGRQTDPPCGFVDGTSQPFGILAPLFDRPRETSYVSDISHPSTRSDAPVPHLTFALRRSLMLHKPLTRRRGVAAMELAVLLPFHRLHVRHSR